MNKIRVLFVSPFTSGGGACRNMFNIISQLDSNYIKKLIVTGDEGLPHEYYGLIETESLGKTSVTGAFWPIYKSIKRFNPKYIFTTTLRGCLKTIVNGSEFSESDNDSCNHEHFVG